MIFVCSKNARNLDCCIVFRLIVGAPVADSKFYSNVQNPGAIYKCSISSNKCEQVETGMWSSPSFASISVHALVSERTLFRKLLFKIELQTCKFIRIRIRKSGVAFNNNQHLKISLCEFWGTLRGTKNQKWKPVPGLWRGQGSYLACLDSLSWLVFPPWNFRYTEFCRCACSLAQHVNIKSLELWTSPFNQIHMV